MTIIASENPFTVTSPEGMDASTATELFVEVFSDFPQVKKPGHAIIKGARGCGKSMMFRCLLPDFLCLKQNCKLQDLDFFAVHVPIKNTDLRISELQRLKDVHAEVFFNEHLLCLAILGRVVQALIENVAQVTEEPESCQNLFRSAFWERLKLCGWNEVVVDPDNTVIGNLRNIQHTVEEINAQAMRYLKKASFIKQGEWLPYEGALIGYLDVLHPFLTCLRKLKGMPSGPTYLLIDDVDNLSRTQIKVLNTWLSTRTSHEVCIKASCQVGRYKTHETITGRSIDSPHDYYDVNVSDRYTSDRHAYSKRVEDIVRKRLIKAGINVEPREFFPVDEEQETQIQKLELTLKELHDQGKGRGFRSRDDATRYARPIFIRDLGGQRKARSSYSYAGFGQLVALSSGAVRYFLDSASVMFDTAASRSVNANTLFIPASIQNDIVRLQADEFLFNEFSKEPMDSGLEGYEPSRHDKLFNLINALGETFHQKLVSDNAERRVFSIALSQSPSDDVDEVLSLGVQRGYFHVATIGNKKGTGRTSLYILNRKLAPIFTLDPTSFAGYLFVTNQALQDAMIARKPLRERGDGEFETYQLELWSR